MSDEIANQESPELQPLLQQLYDDNWLVRASAARKLKDFPKATLLVIARFFELTLDERAPVRAICQAAIENMKSAAVPFLLEQTHANDAAHRERAIELLSLVGHCGGEPYKFATQVLGSRNDLQPDWGDRVEEVLRMLSQASSDSDFSVRFAAASVLDDCNHLIEQTIPVFIEALSKGTSFQKNWAALRLGRIGRPRARAACEALGNFAAGAVDQSDVWDKYAHLAAKVALKRIDGPFKFGLPAIWLVGVLFGLATVLFVCMARSNDEGLVINRITILPSWGVTVFFGLLAGVSMSVVLMVVAVTIRRCMACPYCGTPLRKAKDTECFECGADWSGK